MTRRLVMPLASVLAVVMLALAGLTASTVHADDSFVTDYDTDGNGVISRDEAIDAVADYFAGELTRDQVITVIQYYFSGASVPPPVEEPVHDPPVEGETLAQMIERVRPAVVFFRNLGVGSGSGVIFDTEGETGYVMTAAHVVADVTEGVWVRTDDAEWYEATLLRADPIRDLAVLTICCDDFTAVDFAEPDDVAVGDDVVVMGYPTLLGGPDGACVKRHRVGIQVLLAPRHDSGPNGRCQQSWQQRQPPANHRRAHRRDRAIRPQLLHQWPASRRL